jgi:hypothetical protein
MALGRYQIRVWYRGTLVHSSGSNSLTTARVRCDSETKRDARVGTHGRVVEISSAPGLADVRVWREVRLTYDRKHNDGRLALVEEDHATPPLASTNA